MLGANNEFHQILSVIGDKKQAHDYGWNCQEIISERKQDHACNIYYKAGNGVDVFKPRQAKKIYGLD